MDHDHGDGTMPMGGGDAPFCAKGNMGTVMRMGFTTHSSDLTCVIFLFKEWILNTEVKYAFGIIGAFLMGLANELLARSRVKLAQYLSAPRPVAGASCCTPLGPSLVESYPIPCRVMLGGLHGLQMVLAYWMMLLVMLYDPCIFSGLVVGLALGYGLFSTSFQAMTDNAKISHKQAALKQQGQAQSHIPAAAKALGAADGSDSESVALKSASGYVDGGASGEVDQMIKMDSLAAASSSPPGADVAASEEGVELVLRVNTVPANAPCCGGTV